MNLLVATPTSSEIRDALSDMSPLKSPGPDELHAEFFQKQWHVEIVHSMKDFDFLLDRLRAKLSGWATKTLSFIGRITLAKSVLAAILSYFMQVIKLSVGVCAEIDKLIRGSILGSSSDSKGISLVNWEAITQPLRNGGLGIPHSNEQNMAYMFKLAFALVTHPNDLWVRAVREKYKESFQTNIYWLLGNGFEVHAWHDPWRRNDFRFTDACSPLHAVYRHTLVWGSYYAGGSNHRSPISERHMVPVSWVPLPANGLCLNTDAAMSTVSNSGTVGGLIRNSSDAWISGF
ncbi:hypothetical protein V6N11_004561 [Hibiscus sabdariffa]|uniref:Reverse transcriptase n=1 Tax=Hibiscus sabdariffa TaxID=183260 RepID=A0ABR2SHC4_9ROSI